MNLLNEKHRRIRAELREAWRELAATGDEQTETRELAALRVACAEVHLPWWLRLDIQLASSWAWRD